MANPLWLGNKFTTVSGKYDVNFPSVERSLAKMGSSALPMTSSIMTDGKIIHTPQS